jgi:hypothetical protein
MDLGPMDLTYLSVGLVQDIQRTVLTGRPVAPVVSGLRRASLPAILEYGCLRRALGPSRIPALPGSITSSPLGLALCEVRSELGLRATEPLGATNNTLVPGLDSMVLNESGMVARHRGRLGVGPGAAGECGCAVRAAGHATGGRVLGHRPRGWFQVGVNGRGRMTMVLGRLS